MRSSKDIFRVMTTLDRAKAIGWLSSKGVTRSKGRYVIEEPMRKATYPIPTDSGKKTVIARELARQLGRFDEVMLWIDEFGIWPSSENWYLFDMFRRSLGERKHLHERPGHIFTAGDFDAVFGLLSMVLYFNWGAVLAPSSGTLVVRISHDEFIDVYAKDSIGTDDDVFAALDHIIGNKRA